jgi:hypothetical protein
MMPAEPDNKSNPRKSISRRLRFEILRRDNNTCRYCHATDTPLTIDHVIPVALGGTDEPSNLVACCKDCNAGKTSSNPDAATVAQVSEDAARWADAMKLAVERMNANKAAVSEQTKPFHDAWFLWSKSGWRYRLPADADTVLTGYLGAGMPPDALAEAARLALRKDGVENYWHYFQGVARNMLADLQRDATALLSASVEQSAPESEPEAEYGWGNRAWRKGYMTALSHIQRFESGDPTYWESPPISAFQYRALAMVVDADAVDWVASH